MSYMKKWLFSSRRSRLLITLASALCLGCGDSGLYRVSGTVTYKGQPVPSGEIRFTPHQGNTGPMILAKIRDGSYETPKDKGVVGGPYQLQVKGYAKAGNSNDPTAPDFGTSLFGVYRENVEFPKDDYEHDIVVDK